MKKFRYLLLALFASMLGQVSAIEVSGAPLLHPREAFVVSAELNNGVAIIKYAIADGYYLYRDRFQIQTQQQNIDPAQLPVGQVYTDEFFGSVEIYREGVELLITLVPQTASEQHSVLVVSQGCADIGVCFPPEAVTLAFATNGGTGQIIGDYSIPTFANQGVVPNSPNLLAGIDESGTAFATLAGGSLLAILAAFFGYGLLLAFTPCVLPMVPIVLGVVTGGRQTGTTGAIGLCLVYIFGMATVYSLLGMLTATSGLQLTYYLQHPVVISVLVLVFVLLGAAMLGAFEMRLLPASMSTMLMRIKAPQGTWQGALLFGATSAVIVTPCVAAPLVGALLFIAQSGDVVLGGSALAAMACGMGMLPLAAAAGVGSLLPKTGDFSITLKKLFGLLMFGLAIWIAGSLLPPVVRLLGYALVALCAVWLLVKSWSRMSTKAKLATLLPICVLTAGSVIMLIGAVSGAKSELRPLANLGDVQVAEFSVASNLPDVQRQFLLGDAEVTMVSFYADWCISCKELEFITYADPQVVNQLGKYNLVRADVTDADEASRKLLNQYGLLGPPAVIFFDRRGNEIGRFVGYQPPEQFLATLDLLQI